MNPKLVGAVLVGVVIGVAIGLLLAPKVLQPKRPKLISAPIDAYITIDTGNNNVCVQHTGKVDGPSVPFPVLQAPNGSSSGDTIIWHGPNAVTKVEVQFPQGPPDDPGTPFEFPVTGKRRTDFGDDQDSGPASVNKTQNFPFYKVTVGGQACSNAQGMGVHIDN